MKARLSILTVAGLIVLLPVAGVFAMEVKLNGTTVTSFGGFEGMTVGSNPVATVGDSAVDEYMDAGGYGTVDVFGPSDGGPGARDGDNYVKIFTNSNLGTSLLGNFDGALPGDQLSATVSVYHDTTNFAPAEDNWSMGICMPFVSGYEGYWGQHYTWLCFAPQSAYWMNAMPELFDGAQEGEWALLFHDGAWTNATSGGNKMYMAMDQWIDVQVDLNVGIDYKATVGGVQSDPIAIQADYVESTVYGFQVFANMSGVETLMYVDGPAGGGPEPLTGDLNDDGMVGGADLDIVRANWGQSVAGGASQGDPSSDGVVGGDDLDIVRANWGATAAASAVPEPGTLALLLLGAGFLMLRRKEQFMRLFSFLTVACLVFAMTSTSHALVITNTTMGTVEFDSEGFETSTVGSLPNPATAGNWALYNHLSTAAAAYELVAGPSDGPGANEGSNYLQIVNEPYGDAQTATGKTAGLRYAAGQALAYLNTPALTGDQLAAEFSLYFDTAQYIPQNNWDNVPCISFSKSSGTFGNRHNWITMTYGGEKWAEAGLLTDETGRQEGDMHLAYYNKDTGGWQQFTANGGSELMWFSEDAWHDMKIDLLTGIEFTLTLDGVTSDPVPIEAALASDPVASMQFWTNCTSANAFYLDGYGAAGAAVPEPTTCLMLILGGIALSMCRRKR